MSVKEIVPVGAGVLDIVENTDHFKGVAFLRCANPMVFLPGEVCEIYGPGWVLRGSFTIKMITAEGSGVTAQHYLVADHLPAGTRYGDYIVVKREPLVDQVQKPYDGPEGTTVNGEWKQF